MPDASGGGGLAVPVPETAVEPPRPGLDYFPARILLREPVEGLPPAVVMRRPRPPRPAREAEGR